MEEIRTNLSKEDVVRNMLEIAFYLAQWDKNAHEIDVKVKILICVLKRGWMMRNRREYGRNKNKSIKRRCCTQYA